MKSEGNSFVDRFNEYGDCEMYLELHSSHLEHATNKICCPNNLLCGLVPEFHLTINALKWLIFSKDCGWINDDMINHVVSVLNVYKEFGSSSKIAGSESPNILFGD